MQKTFKAIFIRTLFLCMIPMMMFMANDISAQNHMNYSVHANIVYHFTKYIDWPGDKNTENFTIGVVGNSPLLHELRETTLDKKVGGKKIIVKQYSPADDFSACHILFIGEEETASIKKINNSTPELSLLIVTETNGFALSSSCINFIIVNERLHLEFNTTNIEKRKLKIATELLSMGTIVK